MDIKLGISYKDLSGKDHYEEMVCPDFWTDYYIRDYFFAEVHNRDINYTTIKLHAKQYKDNSVGPSY